MVRVLAKSFGVTLKEHTEDVLKVLKILKSSSKAGEDWWKVLETAAVYHDAGKVWPPFQKFSLKNPDFDAPDDMKDRRNIPHSLLSVVFIPEETLKVFSEEDGKILLSAVAFHHWRDSFKEYLMGVKKEELKEAFSYILERKDDILTVLKREIESAELNEPLAEYLSRSSLMESGVIFPPQVLMFLPSFLQSEISIAEKRSSDIYRKYVFVKGNLLRADRFASAVESSDGRLKLEDVEIRCDADLKIKILESILRKSGDPWQERVLEGRRGQNTVLVAPTGAGKTEFAILWSEGKTVFTLPLRSASGSIWMRLLKYAGEGIDSERLSENSSKCVRLLHSSADVFIYETAGMDPSLEGEIWKLHETARHLSTKYIVSTGDQIFPAAVKYPGYEMIYAVLMDSYLVVDEVQAYSPEGAAVIVKLMEDVSRLGGKFLLMTATLPGFILREIKVRTDVEEIIDAYDLLKDHIPSLRSKLKLILDENDWTVKKAIEEYEKGKKVLVIRNTVRDAVETYRKIKNLVDNAIILHSRMIFEDRIRAEKMLEEFAPGSDGGKGAILVSTQVAEASLNIDFDVLLTDISPADSLVQRMGRVYRKREYDSDEPNVYILMRLRDGKIDYSRGVYEKDSVLKTLAYLLETDLDAPEEVLVEELSKDRPPLEMTEGEKKEMVEVIYEALERKSAYIRRFRKTLEVLDGGYVAEDKREAQEIFRKIASIDVIPENLVGDVLRDLGNSRSIYDAKIAVMGRTVSIPYWDLKYQLRPLVEFGAPEEFTGLLKHVMVAEGVEYERGVGAIY